MNTELRRINAVNPSVSLNAAISYYYRSAKGANVDNTHINNAGTDQAAYWVWYDALARVSAGESVGATESQIAQAAVLRGITDGYQDRLGLEGSAGSNLPWSVTDDIINDGPAPNTFWDTPVSSGFAYANDAVVADVAATANADGTVTISNVTMRILNPGNYYKAVVEVYDGEGAVATYYSYYNYDVGGAGKVSGDLVDPAQPGFLTADRDKADVSAADVASVTVPAGGKALVWIAFGGHYSRGYGSSGKPNDPHINHIRKVGTAKLTLTLSRPVGDIEIMGGTLVIGSQNSVPLYHTDAYQHYLKFLGDGATLAVSGTVTENEVTTFVDPSARIGYSTYPICFSNAVSEVHTWSTVLAASNTGGLVKKGEGTLTLAVVPLYTGETYLEGGTLKIPTSANIKVKTHVEGKSVRKNFETIDETQYTVYTLGAKRMMMIIVQ